MVIAYQNASNTPDTPAATEGSVDFTTDPYTVTAPTGWFITADDTHKITDDTWCTIKAFYYKKNSDGNNAYAADNNTRVWSDPVKSSEAKVSLTKEELDLVVGKISVTANEIKTVVGNYVLDADYISTVAKQTTTVTDFYSMVAGHVNIQSLDYKVIADKITEVTGVKDTVIMNAAGDIVAEVKANTDGLLEALAKNIVLKAKDDGNGEGSYIQLLAESASGQVAAQLSVGTNSEGASFISAVADKINIKGVLQTQDIYIGGNENSYFASDGSGYVANKNIKWDKDGNVVVKGKFQQSYGSVELTSLNSYGTNGSIIIDATESLYTIHNIENYCVTSGMVGIVMLSGYQLGATVKLIVQNINNNTHVLLGSTEGKSFKYLKKNDSLFTSVDTSSSSAVTGIALNDGYYELVAIGDDTWMLIVGYGA